LAKRDGTPTLDVLHEIKSRGGLREGVASDVHSDARVPAAEIYGAGSFYHLLNEPDVDARICNGLSCRLRGADEVIAAARASGANVKGVSCLAACDRAPAALKNRALIPDVTDHTQLDDDHEPQPWKGHVGSSGDTAIGLEDPPDYSGAGIRKALEMGSDAVIEAIDQSGLQGRGGAGFRAAIKWRGVAGQPVTDRYVVLNADEGEPGTFKDRETLVRRPDRVIEGLLIAAHAVGAQHVYCYMRAAFEGATIAMQGAVDEFAARDLLKGVEIHFHAGHGAYICGEETALLEALEGKRGMPRHKPPYPTEHGLWGKPTLMHNVETIACVPTIIANGGDHFRALGRKEPGTKLYSISGHVNMPGTYEMPLGVTLDELVEAAGGYDGEMYAFCPGGAASGFLPASERNRPLDFASLGEIGSMLGSAGVVVLNDTVDMAAAVRTQLAFFEVESCGQCAPCRIGTRVLREVVDAFIAARDAEDDAASNKLRVVDDVAWEMDQASICGLGHTAAIPLTTVMKFFPEVFE
jgi:NADH:ubiquinone oxidoreductase subunit F (NADH-binding)